MQSKRYKTKCVEEEAALLQSELQLLESQIKQTGLDEQDIKVRKGIQLLDKQISRMENCGCIGFASIIQNKKNEWEERRLKLVKQRGTRDLQEASRELQALQECSSVSSVESNYNQNLDLSEVLIKDIITTTPEYVNQELEDTTASQILNLKQQITTLSRLLQESDGEISNLRHSLDSQSAAARISREVDVRVASFLNSDVHKRSIIQHFERGRQYERKLFYKEYQEWKSKCESSEKSYREIYDGRMRMLDRMKRRCSFPITQSDYPPGGPTPEPA